MKIGCISDTHGHLHPRVFQIFEGVDLILHAGDVGKCAILEDLKSIAPLKAVYGNMDHWDVHHLTKESIIIEKGGHKIGLAHGGGSPTTIIQRLADKFKDEGVDIIVYGHTHKPLGEWIGKVYFFNPGDGKKTVGIINVEDDGEFNTEIITL